MTLNLGLDPPALWTGCEVRQLAGQLTLLTPAREAVPRLTANLSRLAIDPEEVVLTGGMAIWAYLVAFHFLHGRTRRIYYQDGRGERVLVAAHG